MRRNFNYPALRCRFAKSLVYRLDLVLKPLDNFPSVFSVRAEAELLFLRALHICEQLGHEHLDLADPLNSLATLYCEQGKHDEAESLCRRALSIREQVLGSEYPETAKIRHNLVRLQEA